MSELSQSDVGGFGRGCVFRNTTYWPSDFAQPSGEYWLPLHPPRFMEWISAPESASLLDKGPGAWMHSLSREQAIDAARQLHRDVCLITSNLNVFDQYVLCLQGTATTILELSLGALEFPSAAVAAGALVPRVASGTLLSTQLAVRHWTVFGMNILLSGPLVETPELLCQSYYFVYSLCVSGGGSTKPMVGGGPFSKFIWFLRGAPLCGDTSLISI